MSITHVVLLQFKPEIAAEEKTKTIEKFLTLKDNCVKPTTSRPYIKSLNGGKDNSPEGLQDGITHAFVVEFENADDRTHYVNEDPAHKAFFQQLLPLVTKVQVVDFTPGVY